jgi:hypothetical protein
MNVFYSVIRQQKRDLQVCLSENGRLTERSPMHIHTPPFVFWEHLPVCRARQFLVRLIAGA